MKKLQFYALFSFLFSATVFANTSLPDNRHIAIRGVAQVKTTPDLAQITFEVKAIKPTALAAKQEVDKRVNALLAGLDRFAIKNDAVSASNLLTEPDINYDDKDVEIITGYAATRTIKITLGQLDRLNDFIDFALSVEINEIEDIDLRSSDEENWRNKAMAEAVANAKSKSASMAKAFGAKLGKVYSINVNNSGVSYGFRAGGLERIEVTGSRIKASDLVPGRYLEATITFSASIDVVFDLDVD